MANAIDIADNLIREELPKIINESLPVIAPIYNMINNTSISVKRNEAIGRGFVVQHLFGCGLAGLVQSANPLGPAFLTGTELPQSKFLDEAGADLAPFPTAVASPHTSTLKRQLTLQMSTGNFSLPTTWFTADALTASQLSQIAREVKAVGDLRALTEAQSFFMASDNVLARIASYTSGNETDGYFTFKIATGSGRVQFFRIGMMVDVLDHAGSGSSSTPNFGTDTTGTDVKNWSDGTAAYIPLVVADVDYLSGVIKIAATTGEDIEATDLAGDAVENDDFIVLRDSGLVSGREMRTWGLEDWMKDGTSGNEYIMGGSSGNAALDIATYSQFKSQVVAVNGPLTETVMNGYVGGFLDAYPGVALDTIITTMGVTLKFLEQPGLYNNRMFFDRDAKALNYKGGWQAVNYSFNGSTYNWIISPMCLSGRLYATKFKGDNIRRYVPPKVGGSDSRIGGDIEFLAPLAGGSSIFQVARNSSGQSLAVLEAPFWQYGLVCPIDVRGVKLTDLTESIMS